LDLSAIKLSLIKKSHIHCDKKSFEEYTGRTRKKYKVLIGRYQDTFILHLFNSDRDSCLKRFRVCIAQCDYADKKLGHLEKQFSYIDASKPEILEKEKIIDKINDHKNGFEYIGRLVENKFEKLLSLLKKARQYDRFPKQRFDTIAKAEEFLIAETLEKLKAISK
jgi:hypothetical protein